MWYAWWEPGFSRSEEEVTEQHVGDENEPGRGAGVGAAVSVNALFSTYTEKQVEKETQLCVQMC